MKTRFIRPRGISPPRRTLLALAVAVFALMSPGLSRADVLFSQGDQLTGQTVSINFPDQIVQSVPWFLGSTPIPTPTGGALGEYDHSGIFLLFNGYTDSSTPLYLHTAHGTAFIEPVQDPSTIDVHPPMYTLVISAPKNYGFSAIDFFPDYNNNKNPGTLTMSAYGVDGMLLKTSDPFAIKVSGEDKYLTITSPLGNPLIGTLVIQTSASAPIIDLKQIDLLGLQLVPEPTTMVSALIAIPLMAGYFWRRRRG